MLSNMPLGEEIPLREELGKSILIVDSLRHGGFTSDLIKFVLPRESHHVDVVCLEKTPKYWRAALGESVTCKIRTDSDAIDELTSRREGVATILIDSVNRLAARDDWGSAFGVLASLCRSDGLRRVIMVLHEDCLPHGHRMIWDLAHVCAATLRILDRVAAAHHVIDVRNRSPSGKIRSFVGDFVQDLERNHLRCFRTRTKRGAPPRNDLGREKLVDGMSSFKIAVQESAEKAKRELVLPYTQIGDDRAKDIVKDIDIDDWDDEDPDDDLNI